MRPWTSIRLSAAISVAASTAVQRVVPAPSASANMPRIAAVPNRTLPIRQANGPSPNSLIAPAMNSFTNWGCSEFESSPAGFGGRTAACGAPATRRSSARR